MKKSSSLKYLAAFAAIALATAAHAQTTYPGNLNTGFGGEIGMGSLTLNNTGTTLTGTIVTNGDAFGDYLVIYIDSTGGGFTSTSGFTDTGDAHRRAISGFDGSNTAVLTFAPTFDADYAIAVNPSFGGLWDVNAGTSHTFISSVGFALTGTNTYTFSVSLASLGVGVGSTFDFSTTYLSDTAYRSNEAYQAIVGTAADGAGNFGRNDDVIGAFNTYTVVPEPGTWIAGALVFGALALTQRRRFARGRVA